MVFTPYRCTTPARRSTWRYHGRSGNPAGSIRSRSAMISALVDLGAALAAVGRSRGQQRIAARAQSAPAFVNASAAALQAGEVDRLRAVGRRFGGLLLDLADVLENLPAVGLVVERQHFGVGEPQQRDARHLRREHAVLELRIDVFLEPRRVVVGRVVGAVAAAAVEPHVQRRDADVIEKRGVVRSGSERADRRRLQRRLTVPRRRLLARAFEPAVVQRLRRPSG